MRPSVPPCTLPKPSCATKPSTEPNATAWVRMSLRPWWRVRARHPRAWVGLRVLRSGSELGHEQDLVQRVRNLER
jgi:hypothetical protein